MALRLAKQRTQAEYWRTDSLFSEQSGTNQYVNPQENTWIQLLELVRDCCVDLYENTWGRWIRPLRMQGCQIRRLAYCFMCKPCLDFLIAIFLVIVLSPLLLLIVLAIRWESGGPAIFRQLRIGKHGRPFVLYKFRTMIPDRRKSAFPYDGADRRKQHKTKNDPRVTCLGQLLRRTSIDELPQLINVIRGEMSLVGPRPELPQIVMQYAPWQHQRHLVKPGLTGWWQVQGRSELLMHEHTALDIYYIKNISLRLDLQILIQTLRILLSQVGAF